MATTTQPARTTPGRAPTAPATVRQRRDRRAAAAFLAPSTAGFLLFTLVPIVGSLVIALFTWPVIGPRELTGTANLERLLGDPVFWRSMGTTLLYVVLYVPLNIALSLGLALWISTRIRWRALYRVLFFLPAVTPLVANALVWRLLLQPRGVVDGTWRSVFGEASPNFLGDPRTALLCVVAMSVWAGYGYNMLIFSAALDGVPEQLHEAARIDGAGRLRRFVSVTLPMLSPAMFFASVMTLITSFQVFAEPYILTGGGPGIATQTIVMYLYQQGFQFFDLGYASAVATALFALIVLVTALQFVGQRRWVHYDQ